MRDRKINDHVSSVILEDKKDPPKSSGGFNVYLRDRKSKIDKIVKEYHKATPREIWEGTRDNFLFGFIGATLVVFIATRTDLAVLLGYLVYYSFMGKIVNRPKYVTDLGKLIVFPIPSALGAFAGYKLSYLLINLIT
jgi:hypothetical protein